MRDRLLGPLVPLLLGRLAPELVDLGVVRMFVVPDLHLI